MEYKLNESVAKLPRETMNAVWYMWELYCKEQKKSAFELSCKQNEQEVKIVGRDYSHTFEMPLCISGTVTVEIDGDTASMMFHEGQYFDDIST